MRFIEAEDYSIFIREELVNCFDEIVPSGQLEIKTLQNLLVNEINMNKNFIREFSVDQRKPFGISAGIVSLDRSRDETSSDLIERADVLMYQRKRNKKRRQASK